MSKHKILFMIYSKEFAGTEKQLYNLCGNLKNQFEITVACSEESAINKEFNNLDVRIVNCKFKISEIFKIAKYIKIEEFDIIHNYLGKAELIGTLAGRVAGVKRIISTKHFIKPAYTNRRLLSYFSSLIGHKVINRLNNKLIAVSEAVKEATFKREKADFYKVGTIYNGTDIKESTAKWINGCKIGVLSRLSEEKGLEYLIEAMPHVLKKYPNTECLIAGSGPLEYELRRKVNDLNLGDRVKFLGFIDNVCEFLDNIDIFVLPSIEEPFGLAAIEAQMRGKPVVAVDAGGPKEIIINGESGLLVPPKDHKSLANGVISLFDNRDYAYKLALEGQKRAKELFTADRMARETQKVYDGLLNPALNNKTKVLIIGHHFVTKNNQRRIEELSKNKDLEISFLSPYWWHEESRKVYIEKDYDKDYAIYKGRTLFTNSTAFCFYALGIYKLLRQIKPDIIDIYEEPWSLTTLQVLIFKKLFLKKSKVMFYSAQNINKKYPFPFNYIEKFTFNNADYCYPCSKGVEDVLRAKGYKGKIKVIPLGLDACEEVKLDKNEVFTSLEVGRHRRPQALMGFTIGYVGRLVEEKGIIDLVNACNRLNRDYKLLIVGDGPLKSRILKIIKFRNIADKIEFAGAVKRADMPEYYAKMDILVAPSRTTAKWKEQFGRMITEAFMYGVPVIGSDSGSIPEVMAGCGVVFREGNASKLKEAILSLMNNQKARDEMIKRGREYALSHYTWDKTTKMIKDIYNELS